MKLKRKFNKFKIYFVLTNIEHKKIKKIAWKAVNAGVDVIQLRLKDVSTKLYIDFAKIVKEIAKKKGIPFIVNDRVDVCLAVDADGVHLGPEDMDFLTARKILGKNKIIGLSAHSLNDVKKIVKLKPDYMSIGPIFPTPTKKEYEPLGVRILKDVKRISKNLKWLAVGGINEENISEVRKAGARSVAVVRAITESKNLKKTLRVLREGLR